MRNLACEDAVLTRRELLCRAGNGFGALALGSLLAESGSLDHRLPPRTKLPPESPSPRSARSIRLVPRARPSGPGQASRPPVHERRAVARRYLRSQADADEVHGKPVPTNLPTERKTGAAFRSPVQFRKYGQSGIEVSEIFSHTAGMIDEICVIRSMHADVPNHEPSLMLMNCGEARQARPSLGSWVLYGLGTENQNLPGFLVMCPDGFPIAESQNWQAAFLPGSTREPTWTAGTPTSRS